MLGDRKASTAHLLLLTGVVCDAKDANLPIIKSPGRAHRVVLAPMKQAYPSGSTLQCDSNVDKPGAGMHLFGNDVMCL